MQLTKPNFRTCLEALRPSTLLKPWKETRNTIIIDKHSDKIKTEIPLFSRTMSSNSARDLFTLRSASSVSWKKSYNDAEDERQVKDPGDRIDNSVH